MSKNLDFATPSHMDRNHISGKIWQTIAVMVFIWNIVYSTQNNFLVYFLDIYDNWVISSSKNMPINHRNISG